MLSVTALGAWFVTAHADASWSGGPIVNKAVRLVRIVERGVGEHIGMVRMVSAEAIHAFARCHGKPGLK